MRVDEGAFDLDDFMDAGRRAMSGSHQAVTAGSISENDEEEGGSPSGTSLQGDATRVMGSSSMMIIQSECLVSMLYTSNVRLLTSYSICRSRPITSIDYSSVSTTF
jgi:hypothetical protein